MCKGIYCELLWLSSYVIFHDIFFAHFFPFLLSNHVIPTIFFQLCFHIFFSSLLSNDIIAAAAAAATAVITTNCLAFSRLVMETFVFRCHCLLSIVVTCAAAVVEWSSHMEILCAPPFSVHCSQFECVLLGHSFFRLLLLRSGGRSNCLCERSQFYMRFCFVCW